MQYGTTVAPGSSASSAALMAATIGAASGASSGCSLCTYSQSTSGPVSSSMVAANSSSKPGRTRPSTQAAACAGITFTLYPAASMVGFALLRTVLATSAAAGPSGASRPAGGPPSASG